MIIHPTENDITQMKKIWKLCFHDCDSVIDTFFSVCFDYDDCYISKTKNAVESMIFMIPSIINDGENKYSNRYLYGVSTLPSLQGKGIMSRLINHALTCERIRGTKTVCCIPATESLFDFYSRFGFENAIYCSENVLNRESLFDSAVKCDYFYNTGIYEFNKVRKKLLNNNCFVDFPEKYLALANGFGYSYLYSHNFYAIFTVENECVRIADCAFSKNGFNNLCYALINVTEEQYFSFSSLPLKENMQLKGVVKFLDDSISLSSEIYLGIKME